MYYKIYTLVVIIGTTIGNTHLGGGDGGTSLLGSGRKVGVEGIPVQGPLLSLSLEKGLLVVFPLALAAERRSLGTGEHRADLLRPHHLQKKGTIISIIT